MKYLLLMCVTMVILLSCTKQEIENVPLEKSFKYVTLAFDVPPGFASANAPWEWVCRVKSTPAIPVEYTVKGQWERWHIIFPTPLHPYQQLVLMDSFKNLIPVHRRDTLSLLPTGIYLQYAYPEEFSWHFKIDTVYCPNRDYKFIYPH